MLLYFLAFIWMNWNSTKKGSLYSRSSFWCSRAVIKDYLQKQVSQLKIFFFRLPSTELKYCIFTCTQSSPGLSQNAAFTERRRRCIEDKWNTLWHRTLDSYSTYANLWICYVYCGFSWFILFALQCSWSVVSLPRSTQTPPEKSFSY